MHHLQPDRGIRWLALALVSLCGCTLSDDSLSLSEPADKPEPVVLKVNVIEARFSESVYETASYFGTVKPKRSSYLSFSRDGRVAEVLKEVGEKFLIDEKLAILDQAELEKQQTKLQESLESAQEQLSRLNPNSRSNTTQTQRRKLNEQIASLEAQSSEQERKLENGIITAPYQGILSERNIDVGKDFPAGRPALKIVEDAPPIVELDVASDLAEKITLEQPVWLWHEQELIEAKVGYQYPELSPASLTRRMILEIGDEDTNQTWVYGDTIEARFWLATEASGYWLPYSALQREQDGLWAAFVVAQNEGEQLVQRRIIEVVQLTDKYALVRGAIEAGDLVIVDGSNRITPGQQVAANVVTASFSQTGPPGTSE